jgi:hypothetical protein
VVGDSLLLHIEIAKRADGAGLLRCIRSDGSVTWQKQSQLQAPHFTLHDLTHFAVETVLGLDQGFYGLIASGWDIEDTTGKGTKGKLPQQAGDVERLVGMFDLERASRVLCTAEDFANYGPTGLCASPTLDEGTIQRIRAKRAELFKKWAEVPVGDKLQFDFGS